LESSKYVTNHLPLTPELFLPLLKIGKSNTFNQEETRKREKQIMIWPKNEGKVFGEHKVEKSRRWLLSTLAAF
jgi:hypothetical protein